MCSRRKYPKRQSASCLLTSTTLLEKAREAHFISNLAYTAAHMLLRGTTVRTAEISKQEWETLKAMLPNLAPSPETRERIRNYYRRSTMLARIGDIAIGMQQNMSAEGLGDDDAPPILMATLGSGNAVPLARRLKQSSVKHELINLNRHHRETS
ncbi:MAG TPA: hypothetical protein VJR27_01605 [Candidatus Saccharimonadales bacterium]|nr:hypothetical protein [Candidatus Saccharimonadales bacterium]